MALCRLSDTLLQPNERPSVGTIVEVRVQDFPTGNRLNNSVMEVRTNQQGVFYVDMKQGAKMRIIIRDLGIDIVVTVPATSTTTLAALMVP